MLSSKDLPKELEKSAENMKDQDPKHDLSKHEGAARGLVQFNFDLSTPSQSSVTLEKYITNVLGNDSHNAIPDLLKPPGDLHHEKESHSEPVITQNITNSNPQISAMSPSTSNLNNSITTTEQPNNEVIPVPKGQSYVDISEYLNMPQSEAAKKLGIPPSTLSKRWKEAVRKRKWPYRMICKIDKEIMTLLHNVPQGANAPPLPEEIETALGLLLRKRQEELRAVVIRI